MAQIGVIIPVYNTEKYLVRCVESVLKQTFSDFEIILVNDGSQDNSAYICDDYVKRDERIHVIHQENGGISKARNVGIEWVISQTDCEWITFIDSDDWVHDKYLELLLEVVQKWNLNISMCKYLRTFGEEPIIEYSVINMEKLTNEDAYTDGGRDVVDYAWGRLYRKKCFENIRYPIGKNFEDVFVTPKLIFNEEYIGVVNIPLYYYFFNPESIVQSPWSMKKLDAFEASEKKIDFFKEKGYINICRLQARSYINNLCDKIENLEKDRTQYKSSLEILYSKRRKYVREYRKYLDLEDELDAWVITKAYPKRMWIYWRVKAILKKISG